LVQGGTPLTKLFYEIKKCDVCRVEID
jgi:hypothetical protein